MDPARLQGADAAGAVVGAAARSPVDERTAFASACQRPRDHRRDGTTVKASSVGRDCSKPKLEQRFGPFQPGPEQEASLKPRRRYEKNPLTLRPDSAKLYAKYQAAQAQVATIRARERERIRTHKERRIEAAMRHVRLKRAALKLAQMPRAAKKLMYGALATALRDEISEIKRASKQEYLSISQKCCRRQWTDWLRHQAGTGNADALASLRRRKPTRDVVGGSINGNEYLRPPSPGLPPRWRDQAGNGHLPRRPECGQGRGKHTSGLARRGTGRGAGGIANGARAVWQKDYCHGL